MLGWGLLGWLGGALYSWWAGEMPPCLSLRQEGGRVPGREVLPGNHQAVRTCFGSPFTQHTLPLSSPVSCGRPQKAAEWAPRGAMNEGSSCTQIQRHRSQRCGVDRRIRCHVPLTQHSRTEHGFRHCLARGPSLSLNIPQDGELPLSWRRHRLLQNSVPPSAQGSF